MIHGNTTMELTYDSVLEALQEWLEGHMASNVKVTLSKWAPQPSTAYGAQQTVKIEFTQTTADNPEGQSK